MSGGASSGETDATQTETPAADGSTGSVSTPRYAGMPTTDAASGSESIDMETESLYSGGLDSPMSTHFDSLYGSLGSITSGEGEDGRISAAGTLQGQEPLFDPILNAPAEEDTFGQEPANQEDVLLQLSLADNLDPTHKEGQDSKESDKQDTQVDETIDNKQRGEKEKGSTRATLSAGGACLLAKRPLHIQITAQEPGPLATPSKTTDTFLAPSPTREKPPSIIQLDSDNEADRRYPETTRARTKRDWGAWRTERARAREERLRSASPEYIPPDQTTEYRARNNYTDGGREGQTGRRDNGYTRRTPRMWAGNRQTRRQYSPLRFPSAALREATEEDEVTVIRQIEFMEEEDNGQIGVPKHQDKSNPGKSGREGKN